MMMRLRELRRLGRVRRGRRRRRDRLGLPAGAGYDMRGRGDGGTAEEGGAHGRSGNVEDIIEGKMGEWDDNSGRTNVTFLVSFESSFIWAVELLDIRDTAVFTGALLMSKIIGPFVSK